MTPIGPLGELANARFEIGGVDQLAALRGRYADGTGEETEADIERAWQDCLGEIRIRTGTLLKSDTVSLLLGAGASKECGGVLLGSIPIELEKNLLQDGVRGDSRLTVKSWLRVFYLAVCHSVSDPSEVPVNRDQILERRAKVLAGEARELPANLESLCTRLYQWQAAGPAAGRVRIDSTPPVVLDDGEADYCLGMVVRALAELCQLPTPGCMGKRAAHQLLLRKLLTRPLNLRRASVFSLNYDTLVEQAADAEGVVLIDGFVGSVSRIFRPESYEQDHYFPAESSEGRVHRLDRVLHLYKLHGSVNWAAEPADWENPYGVRAYYGDTLADKRLLIYPTPSKVGETLGMPYSELFRRFANTVVRPQSTLFVLGFGFGDEHVCAIIRQALAIPSFTLVIVDPKPTNEFVKALSARRDRRVWLFSGATLGTFSGFVNQALPDLRDEDVQRSVIETLRALGSAIGNGGPVA